jgi:2,3-diketo-5-methylthio-1-phosphopentane phosphatase
VLDSVIEKFSVTRDWELLEQAWQKGEIGSRQCLEGQLRGIRITKNELSNYLCAIKLDRQVIAFLDLLRGVGISPVILSDGFTFFIHSILTNNHISGLKVYANALTFRHQRLLPSFPLAHSFCSHCAHCKTGTIAGEVCPDKKAIYIGDGLADVCPARYADIVFAKNALLRHFQEAGRACLPFNSFKDINKYFMACQPKPALKHEKAGPIQSCIEKGRPYGSHNQK